MQEESRSISENVTWGQRKRFSDGKVSLPYSHFLGYDKGEDGLPKINEREAATVRGIYRMFLEGKTPHAIAKQLTDECIPSPAGKDRWQQGTVKSILTNEKYKGDALLQKKYTVDFLTKKQKVNEGEVPQYYVENSHPAIISPEAFDMVQQEIKRRKAAPNRYSGSGIFASRIVCGECGGFYEPKVWHSSDKYRRIIYQCNNKFKGNDRCKTPHLDEDTIKKMFLTAVNELLTERDEIFANYEVIKDVLFNTSSLDAEYTELQNEMTVVSKLIQNCVDENAHVAIRQEEFTERYARLATRFETAKIRLAEVYSLSQEKKARRDMVEAFLDILKKQDTLITEFDERLWYSLLDYATVHSENNVQFKFKDGTVIRPMPN